MQGFLRVLAKVLSKVSLVALWLAGTGLVAMTAIVAWQVYGRYVLGSTPRYAEAASVLLMAWFIFLGAAVGVREKYHLGFDILLYIVPLRVKTVLRYVSDVAVCAFGVGMIVYGWQLATFNWRVPVPTLGISGAFPFLPLVVGGLMIVLFTLERILQRAAGLDPDQDALDSDTPTLQPAPQE